jgi:glycerophosphoryl diester phosphodiesterase
MNEKIMNIAHRGARAYAPENTLPAFAKAIEFGCDMIELDVRMSLDRVIMVYHDEHLLRCTDAKDKYPERESYNLADFNYAELAEMDAGSWFCAQLVLASGQRQAFLQTLSDQEIKDYISPLEKSYYASGAVKIPTLAEALKQANTLGLMVNIELKSPVADAHQFVEGVISTITAHDMANRVLVSSFDLGLLKIFRQDSKTIATAALTDDPLKSPVTHLRKLKAQAYNINCFKGKQEYGYNSLNGRRYLSHLKRIRKSGFNINVWTCNDSEEMLYLLPSGVTGIISDYPNRVTTALKVFQSNFR